MNRSNEDRMASQLLVMFCSVLLTSTAKSENSTSKIDLYIGGFFGKNIKAGAWSSAALIPILEMALDQVNNDSNILVDYNLKYVWRDSKVRGIDETRELKLTTMATATRTPPNKTEYGCACYKSCKFLRRPLHNNHVTLLRPGSYAAFL